MNLPKIIIKVNFKLLFVFGIFGVVLFISAVYLGFTLIPNMVTEKLWEKKILTENSEQWNIFMRPPFMFNFKVYLFHIQNPDEILLGAKPILKEVGPYVYRLHRWKDQVTWNHFTDEISYYEYEKYEFDQDSSGKLKEDDMVTVLNIPYNSFLNLVENISPGLLSVVGSQLPAVFGENNGLFLKTKVKDYLFDGVKFCENGAEDKGPFPKTVCTQIKNRSKKAKQMRFEENDIYFANFYYKNNTHQGYFTIKSGRQNRNEAGKTVYFENKTHQSVWINEESSCNKIGGLTSVFPVNVDTAMSFDFFSEDICRTIKMNFTGVETIQDIKAYKFGALNTTFNNSATFPDNECFCINTTMNLDGKYGCLFDGVLDLSKCKEIGYV